MNNISQISVFDYRKIEILGDLERIKLFFENLDDKELCERLEIERKKWKKRLSSKSNVKFNICNEKFFERKVGRAIHYSTVMDYKSRSHNAAIEARRQRQINEKKAQINYLRKIVIRYSSVRHRNNSGTNFIATLVDIYSRRPAYIYFIKIMK